MYDSYIQCAPPMLAPTRDRLIAPSVYVTIHAKWWYKLAKIFFEIMLDFKFIDSSVSSLQIWS
jgi:hypothetical protein